jgi:RNA polymerase-binding transcription factor DksA
MLSTEEIRRFRERLEGERNTIESRIAANKRGVMETVQEEEGVGDLEDEADLLYEREADLDETARDQAELAQIQKALDRIDRGIYGVSELSGKPIPKERLEAIPSATTLVGEHTADAGD